MFLLVGETVLSIREPIERSDFISRLTAGSDKGYPGRSSGFVLHASKLDGTLLEEGAAPPPYTTFFFFFNVCAQQWFQLVLF